MKGVAVLEFRRVTEPSDAIRMIDEYADQFGIVKRDSREDIASYVSGDGSGAWIAYADRAPVGCIVLRPLNAETRAGEVKRLYVREEWRGKAIAARLLKDLELFARQHGYQVLYLDSKDDFKAAVAFYERHGYQRCERYNENPQATIFMCKSLASQTDQTSTALPATTAEEDSN